MRLLAELRRRNVLRFAVAYLVTAYVVVEASTLLLGIFDAPGWIARTVVVMLAVGFPVALVFSWMYEITPAGIRPDDEVDEASRTASVTGRHLVLVTIVMAMIAVGLLVVDRFLVQPGPPPGPHAGDTPVIAVLPFEVIGAVSGSVLADGLHHDLLTRMSKLRAFAVISRTSMLEYAGTTKNMKDIGNELGAGYILEGNVQTVGDDVRVNAQLIDASIDEHLWAETYDRSYTAADLFAIQSELAIDIAAQLELTLSESDREYATEIPTTNTAAYVAYLRGISIRDDPHSDIDDAKLAHAAFKEAVELDPQFVDAWLELVKFSALGSFAWDDDDAKRADITLALDRVRALAPGSYQAGIAEAYYVYYVDGNYAGVLPVIAELEARGTLGADALHMRAKAWRRVDRFSDAYDSNVAAARLDPRNTNIVYDLYVTSIMVRDCDRAGLHVAALLALAPDAIFVLAAASEYELYCTGDADRAAELVADYALEDDGAFWATVRARVIQRNWSRAVPLLERGELHDEWWGDPLVTRIVLSHIYKRSGQPDKAKHVLDEVGRIIDSHPAEDLTMLREVALRLQYAAAIGDAEATRAWASQYESMARSSGSWDGLTRAFVHQDLLFAYASAGLVDDAIDTLRALMSEPGTITFRFVDAHPVFDKLHDHPGYIELRERYLED